MIFDKLMGSESLFLTGNSSTVYAIPDLDLRRDGPTVVEVPDGLLGAANDGWFRYINNLPTAGKYLYLPPGYDGPVPDGFAVYRPKSYRIWVFLRSSVKNGDVEAAASRSIVWYPRYDKNMKGVRIYPDTDSNWIMAYTARNVFFNGENGQTMNTDARVMFHYPYTAVTPAMAAPREGKGSDYAITYVDSQKQPFDGGETYKRNIPADPLTGNFWAVTVYDPQTRSMLQSNQNHPTVGGNTEGLKKNDNGSYTIFFAPEVPEGYENNWVETIPGKSWFVILRMYSPLKPWIDQTWRPDEVELVK